MYSSRFRDGKLGKWPEGFFCERIQGLRGQRGVSVIEEMRALYIFITSGYVACIFLLADSSMVYSLSSFNLYSLLHLPLYGILTVLLFLSFVPTAFRFGPSEKPVTLLPPHFNLRLLGAMLISFAVAVADEVHQATLPGRDASFIDVLLDMGGTIFITLLIMLYFKKEKLKIFQNPSSDHYE